MRTVKQRWKSFALAAFVVAGLGTANNVMAAASKKNVMCVKTSTGNYYPVVSVSQLVTMNGGTSFNIVLKDGKKENGVESISSRSMKWRLTSPSIKPIPTVRPMWTCRSLSIW